MQDLESGCTSTVSGPSENNEYSGVERKDFCVIADDESAMRVLWASLAKKILDGKRFLDFITAENGKSALEIIYSIASDTKKRIAIILSDTYMGDMTGVDLYKAVRRIPSLREVPFVLSSGANVPEVDDIKECDPYRFRFLPKPFNAKELKKTIEEVTAERSNVREIIFDAIPIIDAEDSQEY